MQIATGVHIEEQHAVGDGVPFAQRLRPKSRFAGQIWTVTTRSQTFYRTTTTIRLSALTGTSVFRHFLDIQRVFGGEPEPDNAAPVVRDLQELQVHPLVDGHRPTAERHAFAKAVHAPCHKPVFVQPYILAVHVVESDGRQVRIDRTGTDRLGCCKPKHHV